MCFPFHFISLTISRVSLSNGCPILHYSFPLLANFTFLSLFFSSSSHLYGYTPSPSSPMAAVNPFSSFFLLLCSIFFTLSVSQPPGSNSVHVNLTCLFSCCFDCLFLVWFPLFLLGFCRLPDWLRCGGKRSDQRPRMVAGRRLHRRRDAKEPVFIGFGRHPFDGPDVLRRRQQFQEILLRRAGLSRPEIHGPDDVLLRGS